MAVTDLPEHIGTETLATLLGVTGRHIRDLAARGVTVTIAALSARCWELWPDRFGLGDTPHPDSAKVTARAADLVGAGRLVRLRVGVLGVPKLLTSPRGAR